jgi:ribosome-associated toxin RatA of RatAB toxin-antitoxin module
MADHTRSKIVINASPAAVMAVIADISSYPSWAGSVTSTEVLEVGPDGRPARARFAVNATFAKEEFVNAYVWDGNSSVSWKLAESKLMASQDGRYTIADLGGGQSEVTYDLTVELNVKVPGMLRRKFQSGVVDSALKDLKKRVESGAGTPAES